MVKTLKSYEFFLFVLLIVVSLLIGFINPAFLSFVTFLDVIRNQTIYIILALCLLPIFIMGGIDISFIAIAALATYPVHLYLLGHDYQGGVWIYFAAALIIGLLVGLFEGFLVNKFKLEIFNMSLGMNMLIYGFIYFFVGTFDNFTMTPGLVGWNSKFIFTIQNAATGQTGLHVSVYTIFIVAIPLYLFLKHTIWGRGIYAIGSDRSVALRSGFDIKLITLMVFAFMGLVAGLGGITQCSMTTGFYPILRLRSSMEIIAGVFLGGASIHGGKGSVIGTILGTILIGVVNQALVYMDVSTQWFDAVIGIIFIAYATFQAFSQKLSV